jgi:drug/metabolite transporter (DMT)-like permease
MTNRQLLLLITLAAIWGSSFLFMRVAVPYLGAVWVAELRVALAALFLAAVSLRLHKYWLAPQHWRAYLILGLFNSALPFALFAYAAQILPASLLSILNATAPIWGAVLTALVARELPSGKTLCGLALGVTGVATLVGLDAISVQPGALLAVCAVLVATLCYGIASVYAASAPSIGALANANGSMWAAALWLLPVAPFLTPSTTPAPGVIAAIIALGVLCSGVAYLLYFKLIDELGAPSALSVTFLIPVFGVLWGFLFLDEQVGWHTLGGGVLVVLGTALVTGFNPRRLLAARDRRN